MPLTASAAHKRYERHRTVEPLAITVLSGGPGREHEVSLASGQAVSEALRRLGHQVTVRDIGPDNLSALDLPADFIFIALHGEFGEDGALQAELDTRAIAYAGSGAIASRVAMNKVESKRIFERGGIPTPRYEVITAQSLANLSKRFPLPAVVKPVSCGSSVDTVIARTPQALQAETARLVELYGETLVERYVGGPELTVGILDDRALPVCEIRTKREFYDYQAKYVDDDTQYLFDIPLSPLLLESVQRMSLDAHRLLGCRVFSRVDWRVDENCAEPFILEVNTIPGFTSHSLLPKAAAQAGIPFDQLCQTIVELSLDAMGQ